MRRYIKLSIGGLVLIALAVYSISKEKPSPFVEMEVKGVRIDSVGQSPVVILMDKEGKRALPIWIGLLEAGAIERELSNENAPRPMTHDLFHSVLGLLKVKVKEVKIVDLKNQTYYAVLSLQSDKDLIEVDARPSDAIILALKSKSPISVSRKILDEQGVSVSQKDAFGERQGIRVQELTSSLAAHFNFTGKKGVLVSDVVAGSQSEASGVKTGDIITKVNSKEVGNVQEFEQMLDAVKPGESAKLSIFRENRSLEVSLPLKP